ncbi:uncharacterized protein PHACADRAFT_111460 [Phanerochaete carnosa HHB-10118-sp]|uniref:F-box domain-containing protein n=1 Tax=Phanerochaete carnosa (strain HHB-10118-sp) TaxID=650164 RepID=K5WP08_PHACS|nr:uncharacterized protein PHACADRAFT_111460 [Phanerochaete carnosa HHB-10118-sp]EKM61190.1 hypothetical protein PHACADRAFT_111460 [Phanerochaete carnosa HHB-10118-sp]
MRSELPVELWLAIFQLAAEDDTIFEHTTHTQPWKPSSWYKLTTSGVSKWTLRTPIEELIAMQHRRARLMKAFSTCRYWRKIGSEFLYSCLYFEIPSNIIRVCGILDTDRHLGRFVRRLHITRYFTRSGLSTEDLELGLISVIQHCRKLETFVLDWPVNDTFAAIADALSTYCRRTLRTLHTHVPPNGLAKLIWTLDSLPHLEALHLEMSERISEDTRLGSAGNVSITFPELRELSLAGDSCDFIEQATEWEFPGLISFTFDFGAYRNDLPDLLEFLRIHGSNLTFLDINSMLQLDVATMLDSCPSLTTFSFNGDWRLPLDEDMPYEVSKLVNKPHPNLTHIGLHQLLHAFGVGYAGTYARADPMVVRYIRRSNDLNFAALTKRCFPKLTHVRLLNRTLLRDLEEADGPADSCYERWERWAAQCAAERVRLEDCTGNELGQLPALDDVDIGRPAEHPLYPTHDLNDPIAHVQALTQQIRHLSMALQGALRAANPALTL